MDCSASLLRSVRVDIALSSYKKLLNHREEEREENKKKRIEEWVDV